MPLSAPPAFPLAEVAATRELYVDRAQSTWADVSASSKCCLSPADYASVFGCFPDQGRQLGWRVKVGDLIQGIHARPVTSSSCGAARPLPGSRLAKDEPPHAMSGAQRSAHQILQFRVGDARGVPRAELDGPLSRSQLRMTR